MSVSSVGGASAPYAAQPARARTGLESLTDSDRDFIAATTGYKMAADSQGGPAIAFDIAGDREMGLLTGTIDRSYMTGLLNRVEAGIADQGADIARATTSLGAQDARDAYDSVLKTRDIYARWNAKASDYFAEGSTLDERG